MARQARRLKCAVQALSTCAITEIGRARVPLTHRYGQLLSLLGLRLWRLYV
jgi:hypothetical protein